MRALFEKCFLFQYFGLCANIGFRLDDKQLLRKLIDKEPGYYFNAEEKIRVLEHLMGECREDVMKELKKLAGSLINETGNHQYKKAVDCVFLLRDCMDEDTWRKYVMGIYKGHSAKRNLWKEFTNRGIYLKMRKGEVSLVGG